MKNSKEINNNRIESQFFVDRKIESIHKEELGLKIPKDYFFNSKEEILRKVTKDKIRILGASFNKKIAYMSVAASIALLLTVAIFKQNVLSSFNNQPSIVSDTITKIKNNIATDNNVFDTNDVTLASLFVADSEIDKFTNNYILEEVIADGSNSN